MSRATSEVQAIQSDATRIAALRMDLIEEMNGLAPITPIRLSEFEARYRLPTRRWIVIDHIATDERFLRVVDRGDGSDLEPATEQRCIECGGEPDWDGEICWSCRDERKVDAEMFARHGGDV